MLIKVIKYLFANLEGSQIPGKIENYFHVIDIDLSEINGQNDDRAEEGPDTEEGVEISEMQKLKRPNSLTARRRPKTKKGFEDH